MFDRVGFFLFFGRASAILPLRQYATVLRPRASKVRGSNLCGAAIFVVGWGYFLTRSGHRPVSLARRVRRSFECLEERIALSGEKVAYLVAGLGGQSGPGSVFPQSFITSLERDNFEVDLANWNSSNYPGCQYGALLLHHARGNRQYYCHHHPRSERRCLSQRHDRQVHSDRQRTNARHRGDGKYAHGQARSERDCRSPAIWNRPVSPSSRLCRTN